jgi:hypothetical protein
LRTQHPLSRRLLWNPFIVAIPFGFLCYTAYLSGFPFGRTLGAGVVGLWFVMSVIDALTSHWLLNWMYSEDDERPAEASEL